MTVAAPRVGHGKLALVILLFAAVMVAGLALAGAFQAREAHADHLDGTVTITKVWSGSTNNHEVNVTLDCTSGIVDGSAPPAPR